ncbi:cytochrome c-type biogenesis protein [Ferrimonas lipolytica]|uniref:Cytochrome c-type biogenesis protein n=1 Tax=Ferrimonas lipolytica TaxID=2724191 RepID=A0A6H1UJK4_9GAMM|nr:cytochrome c-type biogenesis protein [Ferrimonas lipolytica]QIZ78493.1 cytochrome c-type biogenesis protein CcmH [Ferrimonas lipolytica]
MKRILTLVVGVMMAAAIHAAPIDTYEFNDEEHRERGQSLAAELRCPQCQNQNLHDSNSPIAMDMRLQVYEMVGEGKSNDEIITYFTDRYGDFVRYRPAFDARTAVLWMGPVAFLIIGAIGGFVFIRRQRAQTAGSVEVSSIDKEKLDKLLKDQQQ